MVCDASVPPTHGPEVLLAGEANGPYRVVWRTPLACVATVPVGTAGCAAPQIARPTQQQLAWQAGEIGALVHFNMYTFSGKAGCAHDPSDFNPTKLNTDQWARSFVALGARHAVLVAKHGCGFNLWPTNATVPGGSGGGGGGGGGGAKQQRYNYSVAYTSWGGGKRDVAREFLASCNAAGVRTGFYYSLGASDFASRNGWSAAEIAEVEKQQLLELWGTYGNVEHGGHAEIWFDGGFEGPMQPFVKASLAALQPHAIAFNGCVQKGSRDNASLCVTPNPVRWVGTEAGVAPEADWSTGFSGGGDPASTLFQPAESDTTLQNGDQWFYDASVGIRSLASLIDVFHGTVGRSTLPPPPAAAAAAAAVAAAAAAPMCLSPLTSSLACSFATRLTTLLPPPPANLARTPPCRRAAHARLRAKPTRPHRR